MPSPAQLSPALSHRRAAAKGAAWRRAPHLSISLCPSWSSEIPRPIACHCNKHPGQGQALQAPHLCYVLPGLPAQLLGLLILKKKSNCASHLGRLKLAEGEGGGDDTFWRAVEDGDSHQQAPLSPTPACWVAAGRKLAAHMVLTSSAPQLLHYMKTS